MKKITLIGVVVLVIIGCVLAAGCTSDPAKTPDQIVGSWGSIDTMYEVGLSCSTFYADGTGKEVMMFVDNGAEQIYEFTWKKIGEDTYQVTFSDGSIWSVLYIGDENSLVWKPSDVKDQIIGTWPCIYVENGEKISDQTIFKSDCTGVSIGTYVDSPNKEKLVQDFRWSKIGPETYVLKYDTPSNWVATYDSSKQSVSFEKVDYSAEPIVGTQIFQETNFNVPGTTETTFYPNGVGSEIQTSEAGVELGNFDFLWKKMDTNVYSLIYFLSEMFWEQWTVTYDPSLKLYSWDLGQSSFVDNYRENGKHLLDVHITDGKTGTALEFDADGNMVDYKTTWEPLANHSFKVTYDDGDVWYAIYNQSDFTYTLKQKAN